MKALVRHYEITAGHCRVAQDAVVGLCVVTVHAAGPNLRIGEYIDNIHRWIEYGYYTFPATHMTIWYCFTYKICYNLVKRIQESAYP
jgi:hypothetical protein